MNKLNFLLIIIACNILYAGIKSDTSYISGGSYTGRLHTSSAGITRANIDTSHNRVLDADSGTIRVIKGAKTIRDSTTFTGGAYFSGVGRFAGVLYAPNVDIDSIAGDVKTGGSIGQYRGSSYFRLDYNQGSLPGYPSNYYPVLKTDQNALFFSVFNRNVGAFTYSLGISSLLIYDSTAGAMTISLSSNGPSYINGSLKVQACTTSTLNTGNGDNELYPMNQDVRTTASPTFVNVTSNLTGNVTGSVSGNVSGSSGSCTGNAATATTATNLSGGSVSATTCNSTAGYQINGGDILSVYDTGSFACSLKVGDFTSATTFTAKYTIIGNRMLLYLQEFLWQSNSTQCRFYTGYTFNIPVGQSGTVGQYISCAVNNGTSVVAGFAHVINGSNIITLINPGGSFTGGGAYKGLAAGVTLPITLN